MANKVNLVVVVEYVVSLVTLRKLLLQTTATDKDFISVLTQWYFWETQLSMKVKGNSTEQQLWTPNQNSWCYVSSV